MGTLRRQYLTDIIRDAHTARYKAPDDDKEKQAIKITDGWLQELNKHPYFSSKHVSLTPSRKTRDGHLFDEREG